MWPRAELLQEMALEAGFDLVGLGPVHQPEHGAAFLRWLELGRHGEMGYLERQRERIADPARWKPQLASGLAVAFDYSRPQVHLGQGPARIARYAAGRDYHRVLGQRLRRLKRRLVADGLPAEGLHFGVDAVPFLERALALGAGIGFLAKSSMLLSPRRGPWLVLGELLLENEYEPSTPAPGSCGTCRACLDACPTQAIVAPFELDARRCLSYSSIELRGPIPRELRAAQSEWLFGCDICIDVCPFTSRARATPNDPDLALHPALEQYDLVAVLEMTEDQWNQDWTGTAIRRATRPGLRRNAALALGRYGAARATPALERALLDADPGVRSSAGWALARLGEGRDALARAIAREEDPELRADLARSLDEFA